MSEEVGVATIVVSAAEEVEVVEDPVRFGVTDSASLPERVGLDWRSAGRESSVEALAEVMEGDGEMVY